MKRFFGYIGAALCCLSASGCMAVGEKAASLSLIYGAAAVLSLLLLVGYLVFIRQKDRWYLLLFCAVSVVNLGYFFLGLSPTLEAALHANRLAYLGSVFLPLSMLMIILRVAKISYKKWLSPALVALAAVVFSIAASPGILDIYYKEVTLQYVGGVAVLEKVYGPLHSIYLFYLVGYTAAMVAVILRAYVKKTVDSTAHSILLGIAVFVNVGVWLIEQLVRIDFEFLSVSYIISEMFLLGLHPLMKEQERLRALVREKEILFGFEPVDAAHVITKQPHIVGKFDKEQMEFFVEGLKKLTPTEKNIYEAYISRVTTKEIMNSLDIKENTLKFHNKNIYGKLGVSSRRELMEVYQEIMAAKNRYIKSTTGDGSNNF